jgi:hypothetical protein
MRGGYHGVNVHHGDEAGKTKNGEMVPTWRAKCRSGFTTLPPVPLQAQYRCGYFVGGAQIAQGVDYQGI